MKKYLIFRDSFLQLVRHLLQLDSPVLLDSVEKSYPNMLQEALKILQEFGVNLEIKGKGKQRKIVPAKFVPLIDLKLSPIEILSLKSLIMDISNKNQIETKNELIKKLLNLSQAQPTVSEENILESEKKSLLSWIEDNSNSLAPDINSIMTDKEKAVLPLLDGAIEQERTITLSLNGKKYELFPLKVLYLEGKLCLISESVASGVLKIHKLMDIEKVGVSKSPYSPKYSRFEIINILDGLKSINDNQVRIVIKILNPDKVDIADCYSLVSNPYMTTNPEGELIWAINASPNEPFYLWLYNNKDYIQILDPLDVKDQFSAFCRELLNAS